MWFNGANNQNCLLKIANILLVTKEEEIQIIQIFIHNLSISYRSEINSEDDVIWNEDHWAEYAQEYARGELYNRIKWFFVVGGDFACIILFDYYSPNEAFISMGKHPVNYTRT